MKNKTKKILGLCIILISLPPYWITGITFFLQTIVGWTTDSPGTQPLAEHLVARLYPVLMLSLNLAMTFFGIQVFRNRIKRYTYIFLVLGLIGLFPFYSYFASGGMFHLLSEIKSPVVAKMFINRMKNKDERIRSQAIMCLQNIGEPAVDLVVRAFKDETNDEDFRLGAIWVLYRTNNIYVVETLISALHDRSQRIREAAAWGLKDRVSPIENPQTLERLLSAMQDDSHRVRESVARALPSLAGSRAWDVLVTAIKDENEYVRSAAVYSLAIIDGKRAIAPLASVINDTSSKVRRAAIKMLGNIHDPDTVMPLIEALKDKDNRRQVIYELRRKKDPRATEALAGISDE